MSVLAACVALTACGGGGSGGDGSSAPPPAEPRITQDSLHGCPAQGSSPADMTKLSCLVGRLDGKTSLVDPAAAQPCSAVIDSRGGVTVTQGTLVHTHTLSTGRGTYTPWEARTSFSEFTGRAPADAPVNGVQYESLRFGSNTGSVAADGTSVADRDWRDLQLLYTGPADGSTRGPSLATVGSANGAGSGFPRITCFIELAGTTNARNDPLPGSPK
jgi:hypothetical protein